jgi:hypothetical protein
MFRFNDTDLNGVKRKCTIADSKYRSSGPLTALQNGFTIEPMMP